MAGEATRFKKGVSGNPKGRTKTTPLTDEIKKLLKEMAQGGQKSHARMVAESMVERAETGDVAAARLLWEYVEGKPTQRVELDVAEEARRLADEHGLDVREILRTAELIAAGQG